MLAMLVGEIQHLTLEMWIQDSSPATQTPVEWKEAQVMASLIGAPKAPWICEEF
jgi:hypothetical protein